MNIFKKFKKLAVLTMAFITFGQNIAFGQTKIPMVRDSNLVRKVIPTLAQYKASDLRLKAMRKSQRDYEARHYESLKKWHYFMRPAVQENPVTAIAAVKTPGKSKTRTAIHTLRPKKNNDVAKTDTAQTIIANFSNTKTETAIAKIDTAKNGIQNNAATVTNPVDSAKSQKPVVATVQKSTPAAKKTRPVFAQPAAFRRNVYRYQKPISVRR